MTEEGYRDGTNAGPTEKSVEELRMSKRRSEVTRQVTGIPKKDSMKSMSIYEQNIYERVTGLINYFTLSLYSNVCRSIFEKDKLLFSFLLTAKIRQSQGKLNQVQYKLLIENISGHENPLKLVNLSKEWLPGRIWNKLCTCAHKD